MNEQPNPSMADHNISICQIHNPKLHRISHRHREQCLYVWFHGLFGFHIRPDYIVVITPSIDEHKYFAGSWTKETELKQGEWYRLRGVANPSRPNAAPKLDSVKDAVLPGISKIDMDASYFLMRLDFPRRIIPLRYVEASFTGEAAQHLHSPFPLVHIFEYEIFCRECLRLDSLEGWPATEDDSDVKSLHVFAEPDMIMPNEHAMHAFRSLVQMFPGVDLQLKDSRYTGTIPLDKNIPDGNLPLGLSPCEEKSLAERVAKSGTQPANCFAIFGQP
jgi:hypothetical protein